MIMRPILLPIPVLLLLAACDRKPSFDERYKAQSETLRGSANSIEQEVANQISGADALSGAAQGATNGGTAP